jgi:DNA-binding transcriptional MerR regulator
MLGKMLGAVHNRPVKRGWHKIATVSRMTGFSPGVLRAWETRHKLLAPSRGPGGQRLYSDDDVAMLQRVRTLIAEGMTIGEIAAAGRRQLLATAKSRAVEAEAVLANWPRVTSGEGVAEANAARSIELAAQAIARLSARLDPKQTLDLVVETMASDFQAALARIWVYEPTENVLHLRASDGLSRRTTESSRARIDLRRYRYKVGVVGRTREPFISNEIVGDGDFDQRWVRRERLVSVAIVPLIAGDKLQGVMALFFRVALSLEVVSALKLFATVAASSIAAHRKGAARSPERSAA